MNYKKLFKDIGSGELDPKSFTLVVDNDYGWFRDNIHEDDDLREKREEELINVYGNSEGYYDLMDILEAVGINAERC